MKISVDFSIFFHDGQAFGNVTGELELATTPMKGDIVSFLFPKNGMPRPLSSAFAGLLPVTDRIIASDFFTIGLGDINANSIKDALEISIYFEDAFGLHVVIYREENAIALERFRDERKQITPTSAPGISSTQ